MPTAIAENPLVVEAGVWKNFSGYAHLDSHNHLVHSGGVDTKYSVEIETGEQIKYGAKNNNTALVTVASWKNESSGHQTIVIKDLEIYKADDGTARLTFDVVLDGNITVFSFGFSVQANNGDEAAR